MPRDDPVETAAAIVLGVIGGLAAIALLSLLAQPQCPNCHNNIEKGASFCPHCHIPLQWRE
jgi:predicted amidophosphoribosyltransferase